MTRPDRSQFTPNLTVAHSVRGGMQAIGSRVRLTTALSLLALVALATLAAPRAGAVSDAEELTRLGSQGIGAGQLSDVFGLASDPVTGHLYASDESNNRISEFTPWGNFIKAFGWDVASGAVNEQQEVRVRASSGQFTLTFEASTTPDLPFNAEASEVEAALNGLPSIDVPGGEVSVEAIPGLPDGKAPYVYVVAFKGSFAAADVDELTIANGTTPPSGGVPSTTLEVRTRADGHAETNGLESCTAESGCKKGLQGSGAGQFNFATGIAVDSSGNVYVKELFNLRVQKFDSAGRFLLMFGGEVDKTTSEDVCTKAQLEGGDECGVGVAGTKPGWFGSGSSSSIILGSSGQLFVADKERFQRFNSQGEFEAQAAVPGETVQYLAFDPVSEDLYATYAGKVGIHKLDSVSGSEIDELEGQEQLATDSVGILYAKGASASEAEGKVVQYDSEGKPLSPFTCCEPELRPDSTPEQNERFTLYALGASTIGDLYVANFSPGVDSFIRAFGPGPVTFEAPPKAPPSITAQYAISVDRTSAVLGADINPHFWSDTSFQLQYGTGKCSEGGCPEEVPPQTLSTKVSNQPLRTPGIFLEGLTHGTTYHYRFVAESSGGGPVIGTEATFTTPDPLPTGPPCPNDVFRGGPSARLPDCRAYEMVSPNTYQTKLSQSALDGGRFTYSSMRSFGAPKGAPLTNQYLASRTEAGWFSEAIDAGQGTAAALNLEAIGNPYKLFSADLCTGWFVLQAEPLLDAPRDFLNFQNVYRRDLCGGGGDEALLAVQPNVDRVFFTPEPQGVSADGKAAIVRVKDKLTAEAASGRWQTYYASDGGLRLLCIGPAGTPSGGNCSGGTGVEESGVVTTRLNRLANVTNAISADGSHVYWTDSANRETGAGKVYLRINPGEKQSKVSGGECTEAGKACTVKVSETKSNKHSRFLTATPDGAKALFEVTEGTLAGNLYLFDAATGEASLIGEETLGVAGTSEDLGRIYFVSTEALSPEASAGQPNLYLAEGEARSFIATLSKDDVTSIGNIPSNTAREPLYHAARASTDGSALAFISNRSLSGYDNTDLDSNAADSEVYLYEVGTEGPVCVSCNPSGARPRGRGVSGQGTAIKSLAMAALLPLPENMLHTPRALSEDGKRLFFESLDPLLPRDTNGAKDVYEWEKATSREDCVQKGAELYVAQSGGCLSLISNGENADDSEFADASAHGDDVFFITNAGLSPQDPGLYDVYDARVGGGLPPPTPQIECQGETCKAPPNGPESLTPASSTYRGPGDLEEKAKPRRRCAKGRARRKGRCVARRKGTSKSAQRKRAAQHNRRASR